LHTLEQTKAKPSVSFEVPSDVKQPMYTLMAVDLDALLVDHNPAPTEYTQFFVDEFKEHRLHWLVYVGT
jgi:hypothetical protein